MNFTVQPALNNQGQGNWGGEVDGLNECPICHFSVLPMQMLNAMALSTPSESAPVEIMLRCPRFECQHLFIARCEHEEQLPSGTRRYRVVEIRPRTAARAAFDDVILRVSPNFVTIYQQAVEAESHGLDQLVGIGLRKSLEFLIKDFLIARDITRKDEVERKPLALCIRDYVDDDKLRDCVLRAIWLGNDETHYVRKWTDKDVTDLKKLVRLTVLWIERIEYTEEFIREMPAGGPLSGNTAPESLA